MKNGELQKALEKYSARAQPQYQRYCVIFHRLNGYLTDPRYMCMKLLLYRESSYRRMT